MEVREINLSDITVSGFNSRNDLEAGVEDAWLDELTNSILEKALLDSFKLMKRATDGKHLLIAGRRRFPALSRIGPRATPAISRDDLDDNDATIIPLIENVHRADTNPLKARAHENIYEKHGGLGCCLWSTK